MDAGPYIGSVAGSMNMIGNLAGSAAPPAIGYLLSMAGHAWSLASISRPRFTWLGRLPGLLFPIASNLASQWLSTTSETLY